MKLKFVGLLLLLVFPLLGTLGNYGGPTQTWPPDKGSVPLLDELSLNDELEQQPKLETVNLSSSVIAPDEGPTNYYVGVCALDNNDRMTGRCNRGCLSGLAAYACPVGSWGYPAGYVCGRIKATRHVCVFHVP